MQYHVCTFHKCASNWTRRLFRDAADARGHNIWVNAPNNVQINQPVEKGARDTLCLYRNGNRRDFLAKAKKGEKVVLCVRDPKDVVVSQYWSWKGTHVNNNDTLLAARKVLNDLPLNQGILYLMENSLVRFPEEARAWIDHADDTGVHIVRYEDLLNSFAETYARALSFFDLELPSAEQIARVEARYSFTALAGRQRGDENTKSHYRKGVPGDWKNYFDAPMRDLFNSRYGDLCDAFGYDRAAA